MKQAIIFTTIIAVGTVLPIGLIAGVMINKSVVASKFAQAEIDAAKGKEAVIQAETLQKQVVQLSQELSLVKTQTEKSSKSLQDKNQLLQNEKAETIAELKLTIEKQNTTLNEQEQEIARLLDVCRKYGIETNPEKLKLILSGAQIAQGFNLPLEVGQIAYIGKTNRLIAQQVIDENNVICELIRYKYDTKGDAITEYGTIGIVWLANFDTKGLVDGSIVIDHKLKKYDRPLKICGTKTYKTIAGNKTVFLLEPYQIE